MYLTLGSTGTPGSSTNSSHFVPKGVDLSVNAPYSVHEHPHNVTLPATRYDQRRTQRFELRLPFILLRSGSDAVEQSGETRNVSSGGVLFVSPVEMRVGQSLEFIMSLPSGDEGQYVRLRCLGRVVRVQDGPTVAATVERFEFVRD